MIVHALSCHFIISALYFPLQSIVKPPSVKLTITGTCSTESGGPVNIGAVESSSLSSSPSENCPLSSADYEMENVQRGHDTSSRPEEPVKIKVEPTENKTESKIEVEQVKPSEEIDCTLPTEIRGSPPPLIPISTEKAVPVDNSAIPQSTSTGTTQQEGTTVPMATENGGASVVQPILLLPQQLVMQTPVSVKPNPDTDHPESVKKEKEPEGAPGCDTPPVVSNQVQLEYAQSGAAKLYTESPLYSLAAAAVVAANGGFDK